MSTYHPTRDLVSIEPAAPRARGIVRDRCTADGAQALAWQLDAWWHDRGHQTVKHWVERARLPRKVHGGEAAQSADGEGGLFVVRSNLINGLPP